MMYRSISKRRPIRSCLWSGVSLMITLFTSSGFNTMSKIIWAMHLHEDGRNIDITLLDKTTITVDVTKIERVSVGAEGGIN